MTEDDMKTCDICGLPMVVDQAGTMIQFGNWELSNRTAEEQEFDFCGAEYDLCDECSLEIARGL